MKKADTKKMKTFGAYLKGRLKDASFRRDWEALEPEFQLRAAVIRARMQHGMTQKQIAQRAGTKQSAISRFEKGKNSPTIDFAQRLARAVGVRIVVMEEKK